MSITVIIEANVTDFDKWLSLYNGLEDQRRAAGIEVQAFRNQDKPKTSFVIGTAPSKEIFFDFFQLSRTSFYSKVSNYRKAKNYFFRASLR